MGSAPGQVTVVGAGLFGLTTALTLRARGSRVTLVDPGPLPHPLAASNDISKVVRMEYGADAQYAALADRAIDGWHRWNEDLARRGERPIYHQCGLLFARYSPVTEGTFEGESERVLAALGHRVTRLSGAEITRRFPLLGGVLVEGIYNPRAGFAEAGRTIGYLAARAAEEGVELRLGSPVTALEGGETAGQPVRLRLGDGTVLTAEQVLVTAGAWTRFLLPETASQLRACAQPIFHLGPEGSVAGLARPPHLPVFGADVSGTGYYGFPAHPVSGVLKIARHSTGRDLHPDDPARQVLGHETTDFRRFLEERLPALATTPLVYSHTCFYSDTSDGHFLVDRLPGRPGIVVASGDSGHGFKFAPVLGVLLADVASGEAHPLQHRFRWRPDEPPDTLVDAARHRSGS